MPTIVSPATHAQTEGTVGYSYVFAAEEIRQELTEQVNALDEGLINMIGDLAGTGSDTIKLTRFGGVGFAERMVALANEDDPVPLSGYTLGEDTLSIARYGLGKAQTYQDAILQREQALDLDDLIAFVPSSWLATMRYLAAVTGSTFADSVGTSGAAWDLDEEFALIAYFHETDGFDPRIHKPITLRAPEVFSNLRDACRTEPGLQSNADLMLSLQGLGSKVGGAFDFLGLRNVSSNDVPTSGGDHVGCAYVPGAIAYGVASTSPVRTENPDQTVYVPDFGLMIERSTRGSTASGQYNANAWFGLAKLAALIFPQTKLVSLAT